MRSVLNAMGKNQMNERIKELLLEVHRRTEGGIYNVRISEWTEKFAKLIVRECLEACSRANEIRHFVPPTQEQVVLSCMREIENTFRS